MVMRSHKGFFKPLNPAKYRGNPKNIVYRSWLECRFMMKLDRAKNVEWWSSEEMAIPYIHPVDGRTHRYFPDFIYRTTDGKTIMVEIKPAVQTRPPQVKVMKNGRVNKRRLVAETVTWKVNQAKWQAATFCTNNGWTFKTMVESEVGEY